ncbi:MAG: hypothetical protein KIS78_09040 [Labilithrix sp.]|nr:hypothetical protein [Labilithrix sp.]MCW5832540.1 hypothetical protein [Labilithrix sp.]
MICIVVTPVDVKNYVEVFNLRNNDKGNGKVVGGAGSVCALDWADFSQMKAGEKLYLLAHGDGRTIGARDPHGKQYLPGALAKQLLERGLPANVRAIKLVACHTGRVPLAYSKSVTAAYCQLLADEINTQSTSGHAVRVTGIPGIEVMSDLGKTGAKHVGFSSAPEYKALKYDLNWRVKVEGWERLAERLDTSNEPSLILNAELIAKLTGSFFKLLYPINAKYVQPTKSGNRVHST